MLTQNPHDVALPTFKKPTASVAVTEVSPPEAIVKSWLDKFNSILAKDGYTGFEDIIHSDSWWRDFLVLTWDYRTIRGSSNLVSFLRSNASKDLSNLQVCDSGKFSPHYEDPIENLTWIVSMFNFDTKVGKGKGMVRLAQGDDGDWKAHMIYTSLQELNGFPEATGTRRPLGGKNSLEGGMIKGNWLERREREKEFIDEEPTVLIIGAGMFYRPPINDVSNVPGSGQAGLNMGARLRAMGISCLIVDRNARVGDNWRHRYRTLVTHDPVQFTHMAYLPFPPNWPLFTPKDKLGDWFEAYASIMELNIWLSTTISSAKYSDMENMWNVKVRRGDGKERALRPKHVIFCTGHSGEPKIPHFPGQNDFQGTIYHGSQHQDALSSSDSLTNKRVVVVGTGNSGHDIAQNYYEAGASSVTMLQRSGTYVIQADKGIFLLHEGMYEEGAPPLEDADVAAQSLPIPVQFALNVGLTKRITELEKENLEGLRKAGFKVDFGHDGSGIARKYLTRGGGYYIDVGASQLIIDGKIRVEQAPDGISHFEQNHLVLADGRKLEADIVVLATGYDNMKTSVEKIFGHEEASRCKDVWDLDEEGEINAMWRPSGHPGLWFFGGNLALCRIYSKYLALQIAAVEAGLNPR
jgi:cation diffusion facilitator CzcD-associated flavoprotein CzcO